MGVPPFQEFTHISLLKLRKSMLGWSSSGFMQGDQDKNCNLLTGNFAPSAWSLCHYCLILGFPTRRGFCQLQLGKPAKGESTSWWVNLELYTFNCSMWHVYSMHLSYTTYISGENKVLCLEIWGQKFTAQKSPQSLALRRHHLRRPVEPNKKLRIVREWHGAINNL